MSTSGPTSDVANGTNTDTPQQPRFVEHNQATGGTHSDDSRPNTGVTYIETPPVTPRSLTFPVTVNPFSPPASVVSFGDQTPMATQNADNHYPFPEIRPRSGLTSVANSVADLPRMSSSIYSSSRPTTSSLSDSPHASTRHLSSRLREAFAAPAARPLTIHSALAPEKSKRDRPKSTMLTTSPSKPWLSSRDPHMRIAYFLTYGMIFVGVVVSAIKCFFDYRGVPMLTGNLCKVLDEDFSSADGVFGDNGTFFREVDMSGFGNGEFEMTTASENNSFVANGHLYILPTLTSDSIPMAEILDGYVYNISGCTYNITQGLSYTDSSSNAATSLNETAIGSNTFDAEAYYKACSAVSNATAGTIINPVQSARLSTRKTASMKFGRVDVVAKIPTGDWMWPAIWMLPVDDAYGAWPLSAFFTLSSPSRASRLLTHFICSGEIDIMEARGNGPSYPKQGTDYVRGSLNWGPLTWLNEVWRTYGWWQMKRGSYDKGFHTYSLEWTEKFIRIYVDSRLHHMLELNINEAFWDRGDFPAVVQNGSEVVALQNPWINGTKAAPFDQRFYLILDVGVGGTNGWFPDGPEKPWLDGSLTAMRDFLEAQNEWYPTWPTNPDERAFVMCVDTKLLPSSSGAKALTFYLL
ncbi:GH16 beta-1,3-glucan recognition protein [Lentinula raphanica]|uniref:GH16 beta-1,3-glucan recognition protein n=1 Tax=Lentinula raphanica TaxID=153919 RepID=A0AA38P850_9AGAR|nr:GH16 beta-1,3-glucan recognition protein [Lentinula raphanica]